VVVVPTDEQYKERVKSQDVAGNKDIPDEAIMEMKGSPSHQRRNEETHLKYMGIYFTKSFVPLVYFKFKFKEKSIL